MFAANLLAQSKYFNFFNFVSSLSSARTATAGKTFRSYSTINLANNLIQSTMRPAFMKKFFKKKFCFVMLVLSEEFNNMFIFLTERHFRKIILMVKHLM